MFSIEDRELVQHIRGFFSLDGSLPEYHEQTNTIRIVIRGEREFHPLVIGYSSGILRIWVRESICTDNPSAMLLKHVLSINQTLPLGCFHYSTDSRAFRYSASIPINNLPTRDFLSFVLSWVRVILDKHIPEIISCAGMLYNSKDRDNNPTFH